MLRLLRGRLALATAIAASALVLLAACGSSRGAGAKAPPQMQMHMAAGAPAAQPPSAPNSVDIRNFAFGPTVLTVAAGTTVTWTNLDTIAHTVSDPGDGIASPVLTPNATYRHTFTTPGTYRYICTIHPFMHGTVVVNGS